jgi:hypothetical protein
MRKSLAVAAVAAAALVPIGVLSGAGSASAQSTEVVGVPNSMAADPACVHPAFSTIQGALNAAGFDDFIQICPGVYHENVHDDGKQVAFESVDTAADTTVDGGGGTAFTLTGPSLVDGLTITGATNSPDTPGIIAGRIAEVIDHCVFTGDHVAATLTTADTMLDYNDVVAPPTGMYGFLFASSGSQSAVRMNHFSGNFSGGAVRVADPGASAASDMEVTGNSADLRAGGRFAVVSGTSDLQIQFNTVIGGAKSGTGIVLLGNNVRFDVSGNKVTGLANASAIMLGRASGYSDNGAGTISRNILKNNRGGISDNSDTGTIAAHLNILVGNSPAAVQNTTTTSTVDGRDNFYGCNGGPGAGGCDKVSGRGVIRSRPFLLLTSTIGTHSLTRGASTKFAANLNRDSAGNTTADHVLAGEPVRFTFTRGTVNPATSAITNNGTETAIITAHSVGTGTATTKVDNASASQRVSVR